MTISEQDLLWLKVYLPFMYHVQKLHLLLTKYSIADIAGFSRNMLKALKFSEALIKRVLQPDTAELEQILHWLEDGNHHLLTLESPSYPHYLRHIATAPPVLFVQGDASLLSQPQIAIVGSRHASHSAIDIAFEMAEQLSPDYVITSGMALGIDGSAHLGALAAKRPTIAVLGSGFHNLYPRRHVTLAGDISSHGALVTEFPLMAAPNAYHFPRRNRIISGLAIATLIIEARLNSGSLITAEYALEQGRDVLAIPGSIRSPGAQGSNKLIQLGAQMVTSAEDVRQCLSNYQGVRELDNTLCNDSSSVKQLDLDSQTLLECVDFDPTGMDLILSRCQMSCQQASAMLLELELAGHIYKESLGYTRVK